MEKGFLGEEVSIVEHQKIEIRSVFNSAVEKQLPLALWRKPQSSRVFLAISFTNDTVIEKYELENLGSGFLFCPFEKSENNQNHFIKDDILISFNSGHPHDFNIKHNSGSKDINDLLSANYVNLNKEKLYTISPDKVQEYEIEDDYRSLVKKAVDEISLGNMIKVVPARCKTVDLETSFSILTLFEELEKSYPNAFVYIVGIPGVGMWIGATPENLISVDEDNIFKTTSLAGTQKYQENMPLSDAAWKQKEIEEQALVSRYIVNCLKKIRLREFDEIGPKTVKAGNLIHLKTDFIVNLNEVNYPYLPTVMLNLLHPTSAVCGMPKEPALEFIHRYENFNRSYFSGFLGPVNIENNTNVYVNIRCMQFLSENKAMIYAGAGVTIDSVPEREWEETELKMETLLKKIKY